MSAGGIGRFRVSYELLTLHFDAVWKILDSMQLHSSRYDEAAGYMEVVATCSAFDDEGDVQSYQVAFDFQAGTITAQKIVPVEEHVKNLLKK